MYVLTFLSRLYNKFHLLSWIHAIGYFPSFLLAHQFRPHFVLICDFDLSVSAGFEATAGRTVLTKEQHSEKNMLIVATRQTSSARSVMWKDNLLGVPMASSVNVVKIPLGTVTGVLSEVDENVYCTWCGAGQLVVAALSKFIMHVHDFPPDNLTALILYFRRQTNLIAKLYSECPLSSETGCVYFGSVCNSFSHHSKRNDIWMKSSHVRLLI